MEKILDVERKRRRKRETECEKEREVGMLKRRRWILREEKGHGELNNIVDLPSFGSFNKKHCSL